MVNHTLQAIALNARSATQAPPMHEEHPVRCARCLLAEAAFAEAKASGLGTGGVNPLWSRLSDSAASQLDAARPLRPLEENTASHPISPYKWFVVRIFLLFSLHPPPPSPRWHPQISALIFELLSPVSTLPSNTRYFSFSVTLRHTPASPVSNMSTNLRLPSYRESHLRRHHPYPMTGRYAPRADLMETIDLRYEEEITIVDFNIPLPAILEATHEDEDITNLECAVHGTSSNPAVKRRGSLTTLVIDLALAVRRRLQTARASSKPSSLMEGDA